jgi:3-methyladenine DNA glycosylase Tag
MMRDYKWLHEYCLNRFGSAAALEARLPQPHSDLELRALSDDRYLSTISLRIFRAGLKHSLVDAKWPVFEQVFFGFDPEKVVLMGAERLENLMQDARIIRHLGKLKSVPRNAQFVLDVRREKGSFGALIADWPVTDIVGLWRYLAKHGSQLGGLSAPRFLRMVGKDTFIPTDDMVTALKAQNIIDKVPTSLKDRAAVQAAFNQWHAQSGRPLCQLSMMLAYTVNH